MKISGSDTVAHPVATVWDALLDPRVLVATIPGCERLVETGEHAYDMTVTAGVAAIKGTYQGSCSLSDLVEHESLTMKLTGAGAPGTIDATVAVRFAEDAPGSTRIEYDADAVVGGMVGGVGQRMLTGVARKMAGQFFAAVDGELTGAVAAGVPTTREPITATVTPAATPAPALAPDDRVPFWVVLAGVGTGAFWALVGVLVGWRIARSGGGRRR